VAENAKARARDGGTVISLPAGKASTPPAAARLHAAMADSLTAAAAEEAAAWKAAEERRKALGEKVGAAITSAFAAGFDMPPGEEVRVKIICGPTLCF
jgi:hypothetical protein